MKMSEKRRRTRFKFKNAPSHTLSHYKRPIKLRNIQYLFYSSFGMKIEPFGYGVGGGVAGYLQG